MTGRTMDARPSDSASQASIPPQLALLNATKQLCMLWKQGWSDADLERALGAFAEACDDAGGDQMASSQIFRIMSTARLPPLTDRQLDRVIPLSSMNRFTPSGLQAVRIAMRAAIEAAERESVERFIQVTGQRMAHMQEPSAEASSACDWQYRVMGATEWSPWMRIPRHQYEWYAREKPEGIEVRALGIVEGAIQSEAALAP